jgi:hypothetical protein
MTEKSMGVISLLDPHQARFIEQPLLRRLGPEEMDQRNLGMPMRYKVINATWCSSAWLAHRAVIGRRTRPRAVPQGWKF